MNTLTIEIPPGLEQQLLDAAQRAHLSKSELVRRALVADVSRLADGAEPFISALERAGDLVGCFKGCPSDFASNPGAKGTVRPTRRSVLDLRSRRCRNLLPARRRLTGFFTGQHAPQRSMQRSQLFAFGVGGSTRLINWLMRPTVKPSSEAIAVMLMPESV